MFCFLFIRQCKLLIIATSVFIMLEFSFTYIISLNPPNILPDFLIIHIFKIREQNLRWYSEKSTCYPASKWELQNAKLETIPYASRSHIISIILFFPFGCQETQTDLLLHKYIQSELYLFIFFVWNCFLMNQWFYFHSFLFIVGCIESFLGKGV